MLWTFPGYCVNINVSTRGEVCRCNCKLCLLFHLLGVVFNLISSLDDLVWSTVKLVRDDPLKVLQQQRKQRQVKCRTPINAPWRLSQVFLWPQKHLIKCQHVLSYNLEGHMFQLSGCGPGVFLEGAAYFEPEIWAAWMTGYVEVVVIYL